MTFPDDFIQIDLPTQGKSGQRTCQSMQFNWPPPEEFVLDGIVLVQVSKSDISDRERAGLTHVARGARYHVSQEDTMAWGEGRMSRLLPIRVSDPVTGRVHAIDPAQVQTMLKRRDH
jgi:hypothetical protein